MGGVSGKQAGAGAGAGGVEPSDWKARLARTFSRSPANREGKSRDGRPVKVMPMPAPVRVQAARQVDAQPREQATPGSRLSRMIVASTPSSSSSVTPLPTPTAQPSLGRPVTVNSAPSPRFLPPVDTEVEEGTDDWFMSLSPAQAAQWILDAAQAHGGATMDDESLDLLCVEIGLHATELGVAQMQAMGRALAQVFNPPASSSSSSSSPSSASSLSTALAAPMGYKGLGRLVKALFGKPHQSLQPEQAGAFIQGLRLSLPPNLPGADAVFRRAICDAALADAPTSTVIAMTCGMFSAMADPSAKPVSWSRANLPALPPGVSPQRRAQIQEALDMGKRLAFQPCSVLDPEGGAVADRVKWLAMGLRMPKPLANEERFPSAIRNYPKALKRLPAQVTTRERAQLLAAVNQARGLGPLRESEQVERKADRKVS